MYAKGLAIKNHLLSVALSLTKDEIIRLRRQESVVENRILEEIEKQITNTLKFSEGQTETLTFAKAMNQAPDGTIIIIGLTEEDAQGVVDQNEEIENEILNAIDSQCKSAYIHRLKLEAKKETEKETQLSTV